MYNSIPDIWDLLHELFLPIDVHFRGVDLLVTDNHNMYIGKLNSDLDKIDSWQLIQSQNCPEHIHIKKNAKWKGEEVENIKINSNIISMDLWLEFLGYFISEGHTCSHKKVMSNGDIKYYGLVGISQNKKESREKMQNCVNKLPFRFSSNMVSYNKDLYNELKIYGKAHQKYIPTVPIKSITDYRDWETDRKSVV